MTMSKLQTITGTGVQTEITVGAPKIVSFVLNTASGSPVATLEVLLTPNGTWSDSGATVAVGVVETTAGPIIGARLNVSVNGTGTTFELVGISR